MRPNRSIVTMACVLLTCVVLASGCICWGSGSTEPIPTPKPILTPTPTAFITPLPGPSGVPTGWPTLAPTVTPGGTNGSVPGNNATPTPTPIATPTPIPTPTPVPNLSGRLVSWGTDKDLYVRGTNATCWADVENTGNVPIEQLNLSVKVYMAFFGYYPSIPLMTFNYTATGLGIQPGETKRVEYIIYIPMEVDTPIGKMSTAGSYRFDGDVLLAGKSIGTFSKYIAIGDSE